MERIAGDRVLRLWITGGRGRDRSADRAGMGVVIGQNDKGGFGGVEGKSGVVAMIELTSFFVFLG